MTHGYRPSDPGRISTLQDLTQEIAKLRRRAAKKGQLQLSVREIAAKVGKAPSTLDPYLRGQRLCPVDTYEQILRALGVANDQLRPWLDAWERVADTRLLRFQGLDLAKQQTQLWRRRENDAGARATAPRTDVRRDRGGAQPLSYQTEFLYRLVPPAPNATARVGIVTGDIRRVRCAEIWVNSENADMRMSRFDDYSVSAIIRFEGALRDEAGRVVADYIADELDRKMVGKRPVPAGTAIVTGAGKLTESNGVRHIIHVAAVLGEPGEGYRQIRDVSRCVTSALAEAERLGSLETPIQSILFPILGTGVGGAQVEPTVVALLGAAVDHLTTAESRIRTVYFSAYTDVELAVCKAVFDANPRLIRAADD